MPRARLWSLLLPPVLALAGAVLYTGWQASEARRTAEVLCSQIAAGDPIEKFVHLALAAHFEVEDAGASTRRVTARKVVSRLKREIYACEVMRADGKVVSARTQITLTD